MLPPCDEYHYAMNSDQELIPFRKYMTSYDVILPSMGEMW